MITVLFCFLAYLLGSVPTAVWIGKSFFDIDVRDYGSGNAGATNVFRVLGKTAGSAVLLLDILKGLLAARLSYLMANTIDPSLSGKEMIDLQVLFGVMAVLGHLLPIFAKFKGGKGVATLFGMIITLNPQLAMIAVGVFLLFFLTTGFVSLGSMMAGISLPVLFVRFYGMDQWSVLVFSIAVAVLVVFTHRKNIKRLIKGEENRAKIFHRPNEKNRLA